MKLCSSNDHYTTAPRTKDNQALKFGQLTNHSMRNIFIQKLCRKSGRETSSRPLFFFFFKKLSDGKSKWSAP